MILSPTPIGVYWGKDLIHFYNDAKSNFYGAERHPRFFGRPGDFFEIHAFSKPSAASENWSNEKIWSTLESLQKQVIETGVPVHLNNFMMPLLKDNKYEERYGNLSYSPIVDDNGKVI